MTATAIEIQVGGGEGAGIEEAFSLPWQPPQFIAVKGIVNVPAEEKRSLSAETRDGLLSAIAKARVWLNQILDHGLTIGEIARREGKVERHIRLLLLLGFVTPLVVPSTMARLPST